MFKDKVEVQRYPGLILLSVGAVLIIFSSSNSVTCALWDKTRSFRDTIHFPTSERCERTIERTSEWPSTPICILNDSGPPCRGRFVLLGQFVRSVLLIFHVCTPVYPFICPFAFATAREQGNYALNVV